MNGYTITSTGTVYLQSTSQRRLEHVFCFADNVADGKDGMSIEAEHRRRPGLFNVKPGEGRLVFSMLVLLAINTMVYQISSVVATADFLGTAGAIRIPVLWIVDVVIILVFAGVYSLIVDQVPRIKLMTWLFMGFALLYLAIQLMMSYGVPSVITSGLLYVLADQQLVIFPLAFWSLANDIYSMSESRRLFPLIAAGAAAGSVIGSGVAAASAAIFKEQGQHVSQLLVLGAFVFLLGLTLLHVTFRQREIRARQSSKAVNVIESIKVGFDVISNVPLFRYMGLAMLFTGLSFAIIEYHFLFSVHELFGDDSNRITTFYGVYQMILILGTWLFQWLITGRILKDTELKNTFTALPGVLLFAVVAAGTSFLAIPGIIGAAGGRFLGRLVQRGWDEPVRKAAQGLVPDERRGRVSTFLDSYLYSVATLVVCIFLIILIQLSAAGLLSEATMITIYLVVSGIGAGAAIWSALQLRKVYDQSLLNWRLSRSRRKSVLDGIEF